MLSTRPTGAAAACRLRSIHGQCPHWSVIGHNPCSLAWHGCRESHGVPPSTTASPPASRSPGKHAKNLLQLSCTLLQLRFHHRASYVRVLSVANMTRTCLLDTMRSTAATTSTIHTYTHLLDRPANQVAPIGQSASDPRGVTPLPLDMTDPPPKKSHSNLPTRVSGTSLPCQYVHPSPKPSSSRPSGKDSLTSASVSLPVLNGQ